MEGEGLVGEVRRTIRRLDLDFGRGMYGPDWPAGDGERERSTRALEALFGATCDPRSLLPGGFLLVEIVCFLVYFPISFYVD